MCARKTGVCTGVARAWRVRLPRPQQQKRQLCKWCCGLTIISKLSDWIVWRLCHPPKSRSTSSHWLCSYTRTRITTRTHLRHSNGLARPMRCCMTLKHKQSMRSPYSRRLRSTQAAQLNLNRSVDSSHPLHHHQSSPTARLCESGKKYSRNSKLRTKRHRT